MAGLDGFRELRTLLRRVRGRTPNFHRHEPCACVMEFNGVIKRRRMVHAFTAALLAQHLTARPTEDLDFFTAPERGHVPAARDALEAAASQRGSRCGAA